MVNTEFLAQYTVIRSNYFDLLDTANKERGCVPMKYMIALYRSLVGANEGSLDLFDYFVEEWSKQHPEAFNDSNR